MPIRSVPGAGNWRVVALFTLSGATGLLYEVAWVRRLTLVFGNTTQAASVTLAIFFLGLALGAAVAARASRRLRRPLQVYGCLELVLGLYAAATPWAFDAALPLYRAVYRAWPAESALLLGAQVGLCVLVLLPPTALMGATLPVLSAGLARRTDGLSARIGRLYGWNTAGAAAGTLLTGFVFLGTVGVTRTIWLGAATSVAIGLAALALAWRASPATDSRPHSDAPPPAPASRGDRRVVLGVMAVSGALALAYEVTWTRLSVYALGTTAYAFTVMLVTYLVGLAWGGLLGARAVRRRRATFAQLAWMQLGVGVSIALSLLALQQLPAFGRAVNASVVLTSAWGFYAFRFAECFLVMLLPTLFLGATFPLAVDLLAPARGRAARAVGRLYAWNTVGGVCGAGLAGFALIPALGTVAMLRVGIGTNAALAALLVVAGHPGRRRRSPLLLGVGATVLVAAVGLRGADLTPLFTAAEFGSVVEYQDEGVTGTVTIHRYVETGVRVLSINGCNVAGTTLPLRTTQKLQGHLPALLHGHARTAMQIGFGSGETAKVLLQHGVRTVHGIEISPEVIAAGIYFAVLNGRAADNGRFQLTIMDAVNYARLTERTYDLILNDATFPGLAGSSALYTRDHFAACAARLNPGGIFSCWVPLDVTPATFRMILASLTDVFPYTQLWLGTNCDNKNALLVASRAPLRLDLAAWERRLAQPDVHRDLHEIRIAEAAVLAGYLRLDTAGCRALAAGAPLNTHDAPRLEYAPFNAQGYNSRWAENLTAIVAHCPPMDAVLSPRASDRADLVADLRRERNANAVFLGALVQQLRNHPFEARKGYERTLALQPAHRGARYTLARMRDGVRRMEARVPHGTTDPTQLRELTEAYWRGGRPAEAVRAVQRLLQRVPGDAAAEELLVVGAIAAADPAPADAVIDRILARHPDDPTWQYSAVLLDQIAGRSAEAAAGLEALVTAHATYRPGRYALARLRMRRGDFAAGERLLRADPDAAQDPEWYRLLALACAGQGRGTEARAAAAEALRRTPDSPDAQALVAYLGQLR